MNSKISFTIRPPTSSLRTPPITRNPSQNSTPQVGSFTSRPIDSSDEEDEETIEAITGFDKSGAQRLQEKSKPSGPLVIPPLANRDWRAVARLRKKQSFVPDSAAVQVGTDGSQGGLGTRDTINSGPQAVGLVVRTKMEPTATVEEGSVSDITQVSTSTLETPDESEDERARRALLASAYGGIDEGSFTIDAIPVGDNNYVAPVDESDAFKRDVVTRPNSATLADYERVPVSQFGAALLRGMGWKEGTAASRTRRGLVEPWLPTSRPALLGIGAKERPAEDIPISGNHRFTTHRPDKRYVPLVKVQREDSDVQTPSRSRSRSPGRSRPASRAPSPRSTSLTGDRDRDRSHRREGHESIRDDSSHGRSGRNSSHGKRAVDSDREVDYSRRRERADPDRDRDHRHDRGRNERSRMEKSYGCDEKERCPRDRGGRN